MKKRELLPKLNDAIVAMCNMSADAAKLEITDNDQASRRLKRDLTSFKNGPLKELYDSIVETREQIKYKKPIKKTES